MEDYIMYKEGKFMTCVCQTVSKKKNGTTFRTGQKRFDLFQVSLHECPRREGSHGRVGTYGKTGGGIRTHPSLDPSTSVVRRTMRGLRVDPKYNPEIN